MATKTKVLFISSVRKFVYFRLGVNSWWVNAKVKRSLCKIWRLMKEGRKSLALDGVEWSASRSGRFYHQGESLQKKLTTSLAWIQRWSGYTGIRGKAIASSENRKKS
jgi:hypothetical protein